VSRLVPGCGLHVRWLSRFFRLAGRRLNALVLLPAFAGRRVVRLFPLVALRVRCCACADYQ